MQISLVFESFSLYFSLSSIIIYCRYKDIPHNLDRVLCCVAGIVVGIGDDDDDDGGNVVATVVVFCFDKQIIVYHKNVVSAYSCDDRSK